MKDNKMWTLFADMYSGGSRKEQWEYIYIEASEKRAIDFFKSTFDHSPFYITCQHCGKDYEIYSDDDIYKLTEYYRNGISLEEYKKRPEVLFISKEDIIKDVK